MTVNVKGGKLSKRKLRHTQHSLERQIRINISRMLNSQLTATMLMLNTITILFRLKESAESQAIL